MGSTEEAYRKLVERILTCTKCPLHRSRKKAVPGEGPLSTRIMLVGEAPGRSEDEQGRPFVGAAGSLLNQLLKEAGLDRSQVYITNVVKCRPPGNRDPSDDEISACLPYLIEQIKLIKPRVIVALGRHAGRTLFTLSGLKWDSISKHRGKVYEVGLLGSRVKLVVTYHPAAALYKPPLRDVLSEDFRTVVARVARDAVSSESSKPKTILDFLTPSGKGYSG
jgi:DNA polymerase